MKLALESEWDRLGARTETRIAVLQDAIKVAAIRADVKVIVFGPYDRGHGVELFGDLEKLRKRSEDPAAWLCVSLPWSDEEPAVRVLKT